MAHSEKQKLYKRSPVHLYVATITEKIIKRPRLSNLTEDDVAKLHFKENTGRICCDTCGLEMMNSKSISTQDERSGKCTCSRPVSWNQQLSLTYSMNSIPSMAILRNKNQVFQHHDAKLVETNFSTRRFVEAEVLKQIRKRTFSDWPFLRTSISSERMIEAGFFRCNIVDRVICLYCNIICQQWNADSDDPCEVHKILSPYCPFVKANLTCTTRLPIPIINGNASEYSKINSVSNEGLMCVSNAINGYYTELPNRFASFETWPNENLPSIDNLVHAGFFYTGKQTVVTCFYCNGSLQNWSATDDPRYEHAKWFPNCAYIKQFCGADLYKKIRESTLRKALVRCKASLGVQDTTTLSHLVDVRLELPISKRLIEQKFDSAIVERCWKDQLQLKGEDFASDSDLIIACVILQKQIKHINSKKENLIIPSVVMNKIRENKEGHSEMVIPSGSIVTYQNQFFTKANQNNKNNSSTCNPCIVCLEEEKCIACLPCGHLAACVPCGHSLKRCPICRSNIEGFYRISL